MTSTTKLLAAIMFGAVNAMGEHMGTYGYEQPATKYPSSSYVERRTERPSSSYIERTTERPSSSYVERTTERPTYEPTPQPTRQYNPYKADTTYIPDEPDTTYTEYIEDTEAPYEADTTYIPDRAYEPDTTYIEYVEDTPYEADDMCYDIMDNNPCSELNRAKGKYHFPSCADKCNFIQCDEFGNGYDMPCAPGTIWDPIAYTCNHDLYDECPTKYTPPADTTYEKLDKCHDTKYNNPCTEKNIAAGHLYHPSCTSCCDFIQCDKSGKAFDMPCAEGTVWDPIAYTCNHNYGQCDDELCAVEPEPKYTPDTPIYTPDTPKYDKCYDDGYNNPCTAKNRERGQFYFKSCNSCCKFIQCDAAGQAFERPCAPGTYWDQDAYTCNFNNGQCKDNSCQKKKVTPSPTKMQYDQETTKKGYGEYQQEPQY